MPVPLADILDDLAVNDPLYITEDDNYDRCEALARWAPGHLLLLLCLRSSCSSAQTASLFQVFLLSAQIAPSFVHMLAGNS